MPAQIHFHLQRSHTITTMNGNINLDSTITDVSSARFTIVLRCA